MIHTYKVHFLERAIIMQVLPQIVSKHSPKKRGVTFPIKHSSVPFLNPVLEYTNRAAPTQGV